MDDPLVFSSATPKVSELIQEYQQCTPQREMFHSLDDADRIRFAEWDGQSEDGRKHDTESEKAFPWDGASDVRVLLADSIINEMKDTCAVAFWRAVLRSQAVGPEDAGMAAGVQKVVSWFIRRGQRAELRREVELSAQYLFHYGWCLLHPTWSRRVRMRPVTLELPKIGEQNPDLANAILDPTQEDQAVGALTAFADQYVAAELSSLESDPPRFGEGEVRRLIRQLREEGKTRIPVPYVCSERPSIIALKPYEDVFIHPDTSDIQRARVFVKHYLTEVDLRQMALTEGWDEGWIDQAAKCKGQFSHWSTNGRISSQFGWYDGQSPYIEVVYAYYPSVDDDGVEGIYCTVFHAQLEKDAKGRPLYAKHGIIDFGHGQMPFIEGVRERISRRITTSRGVPEIVSTWQREMKVQRDGIVDRTSFGTLPPILVPAIGQEVNYRFGPAVQVPFMAGRRPEFMEVPKWDPGSIAVLERIDMDVAIYFALITDKTLPTRWQVRQQAMINNFMGMWEGAFLQELDLLVQYLPSEKWQRIAGIQVPNDARALEPDLTMSFDVRELDVEHTAAKLDAISKSVVPEDVTGVVDRAALTRLKLRAIDPTYEEMLVSDQAGASQELFDNVRNEIAQMALGNQPLTVENDPTAQAKLNFAAQIVSSNPLYQNMLNSNERFRELMTLYAKNLTFSVSQEKNKKIGRIGVDVDTPAPDRA